MLILADESMRAIHPTGWTDREKNLLSDGDIPHRKKGEDIINCPEEKGGKDDALLNTSFLCFRENHGRKLTALRTERFRCSYHRVCATEISRGYEREE